MHKNIIRSTLATILFSLAPATTSAATVEVNGKAPYTLYVSEYNIETNSYKNVGNREQYDYILTPFKEVFQAQGRIIAADNGAENADIHIIFTLIPLSASYPEGTLNRRVPDLLPDIPQNKHAAKKLPARQFGSPWMDATLYYAEDGTVAGSTILVPVAPLPRIRELYLAFRGHWTAIVDYDVHVMKNITFPESEKQNLLDLYEKAFFSTPQYRPTIGHIEEVFADKGEAAVTLGALAGIAWQTTRGPFVNTVSTQAKECLSKAQSFYRGLYRELFPQLFISTGTKFRNSNQYYNLILSAENLRSVAKNAGDYNCFIGSRLDERSQK